MKASLAVQHGIIPPNMLFENLSPKVAPYYGDLSIVTTAKSWPRMKPGQPRRASVNSFGFGGTNAHAIVESYDTSHLHRHIRAVGGVSMIPLAVSANSEHALKSTMEDLLLFLRKNHNTNISDLAWTLMKKRSVLSMRRALSAETHAEACAVLEKEIALVRSNQGHITRSQHKTRKPRILAIFTGQGKYKPLV